MLYIHIYIIITSLYIYYIYYHEQAVCGVGLIEPADTKIKENLESQDLLYTVMEYANNEIKPYIVGSLVEYLLLSENITEIFEKIIKLMTGFFLAYLLD